MTVAQPSSPPARRAIVPVLAFAGIVVSLMQSIIIPLVPRLPALLNAPATDTAWAITVTLLAGAVATPVVGRLGDMIGKRTMLLVSLSLLIIGSVTVALSDGLALMVVGRALQGLAAGVIPLGISIMRDELPSDRLGSAIALMSASLGVGGALGLPVAAFVAEQTDWHVLFWASAALGVIVTALVVLIVPESPIKTPARFDLIGAFGLSLGLVCLLLVISKGADFGWLSVRTWGLLVGGAIVLFVWGRWELRRTDPLVDLRTAARRPVLLTNIASAAFGLAMFAMSLVYPQLLLLPATTGYGLGQSMLVVGLVMAPSGLVMMTMAPVSARISRAKGPRTTMIVGAVVVAIGYGVGLVFMSEVWHLVLSTCIIGSGIGLAYGAMPGLIMRAVPVHETAAANSLNTLMRSLGTSVSSALAGVILAEVTVSVGGSDIPSVNAFRLVLGISILGALAALTIMLFLRDDHGASTGQDGQTVRPAATEGPSVRSRSTNAVSAAVTGTDE